MLSWHCDSSGLSVTRITQRCVEAWFCFVLVVGLEGIIKTATERCSKTWNGVKSIDLCWGAFADGERERGNDEPDMKEVHVVGFHECYLVDPASSHMLVSKIKPCRSKSMPH